MNTDSVQMGDPSSFPDIDESLYPIAVLMDELKHEDVSLRINAISRISTIALALGPERTRDELIPFLDESIEDEDELLAILAGELGNFVNLVGGPEFAHLILAPLEHLSAVEETAVRSKAVESINKICTVLSNQQIEEFYVPMLKRLNGDYYTEKSSLAGVLSSPYSKCTPSTQADLRELYSKLCHDDTPMVRRAAGSNLAAFIKCLDKETVISAGLPMFNQLVADGQDSVRLLTVEPLVAIAEALTHEEVQQILSEVIRGLCQDKSWRVRYMVAEQFVKLSQAVGDEIVQTILVENFVNLLRDKEAEVRTIATSQIPGFGEMIKAEGIIANILPNIQPLTYDTSQHVRAALASHIAGLAPVLGKDQTIELLLPLFLRLLKDEFPDVRLNIISRLEQVNKIIGVELLSQSLLPAIVELAEDKQWRVRLAIIEYVPLLAAQLGVQFFDEKLGNLCLSWLGDSVFSIREAGTINLKKLTESFGVDWAKNTILPKILGMASHPNHLARMTTIFAITTIAPALTPDVVRGMILPVVVELSNDPIPNIRFNAAKSLAALIDVLKQFNADQEIFMQIKQLLEKLASDPDRDVQFFANQALATAAS